MSLRVAATIPIRVDADGQHFTVGRKPRTVTIALGTDTATLTAKLTLRAGRLNSTTMVLLPRR